MQTQAAKPDWVRLASVLQCRRTHDEANLWLTPYNSQQPPSVTIEFTSSITIAMIRVWVCSQQLV